MFTGIIEEKGKIRKIVRGALQKIEVQSSLEVKMGDSVAIQGVCLTVTGLAKKGFTVEAMAQTKGSTTLSQWKSDDHINLERALGLGDRVGGHILLGHVDEVGKLIRIGGNNYFFQISTINARYLVNKGSIAIDGVSLTIGSISENIFTVSLTPYTLKNTTLGNLKPRSFVNIEYDYLVKILKTK